MKRVSLESARESGFRLGKKVEMLPWKQHGTVTLKPVLLTFKLQSCITTSSIPSHTTTSARYSNNTIDHQPRCDA